MGRIILHAGMGKAGSSSIQTWLRDHGDSLRDEAGMTVLRATVDPIGNVALGVAGAQNVNSGEIVKHYMRHPEHRQTIATGLQAALDDQARSHGAVVLSGEAFGQMFWRVDELFLRGLDEIAATHRVQVAYYVRPQHLALEAGWRQWGFRRPHSPSEYLLRRCQGLNYLHTLSSVNEIAPNVMFTIRPFRRDLLDTGDVVADFGRTCLGVDPASDQIGVWENRGLPLDLINVLHAAPPGLFWATNLPRDVNPVLAQLRQIIADWKVPESDQVQLSRLVLQQVAHERFEADNRRLISELGWNTEEWVPPVGSEIGEASLERLDELWQPDANSAELDFFHQLLARLLRQEPPPRGRNRIRRDPHGTAPGDLSG